MVAVGMSYDANAGYAINPADDIRPRSRGVKGGWGQI
jgi:glycerol uptake facilitator protein